MLREIGTYCRENTQNNNISGGQLMPPRGLEYYRWRYINKIILSKDELSQKAICGQKSHFWRIFVRKAKKHQFDPIFFKPEVLSFVFKTYHFIMYSRRKEEKLTMMHFEALLSVDDLLAIWSLESLQLHQFMILSQYQYFADLIFTRIFFSKCIYVE